MNQNTPTMDGSKRFKSQIHDTNSISGSIVIQNNCDNSQLSSPDMSEANELRSKYSLSSTNLPIASNNGNDEKDDKHRSSSLKIPSVIKMEQQSVRVLAENKLLFCFHFVFIW